MTYKRPTSNVKTKVKRFYNINSIALAASLFLLITSLIHVINDLDHEVFHINVDVGAHHGVVVYALFKVAGDFVNIYKSIGDTTEKID